MGFDITRTAEALKGQLRPYVESITQKSKGGLYVCPLCHSGTGPKATGAFGIYDNGLKWKCQACGKGGDIFDLIGEYEGIADYKEQVKRAGELYGMDIQPTAYTQQHTHERTQTTDYTAFFLQANKDIDKTDYHRGISRSTLDRFKIGYVESWKHPKAPNAPGSPRLIIPTSKESYLARDTREQIPEAQKQYSKSKVGRTCLFNAAALQSATMPIFIVEGEIDALSIVDVGGEAVALGSTAKVKSLLEVLKANKPPQPLIIALDNDSAGEKAAQELTEGLKVLDIPFYKINPYGESKDANEALQRNREALREAVEEAEHIQTEAEQRQKEEYLSTSTAHYLQGFIDRIADSRMNTQETPTGFSKLDATLDGGLYEGLYVVGAISSLGKTTLALQIADQIAQAGQDVLIFSLEMARAELMAKSISRHTLQRVLSEGGDIGNAKTARGITTGKRYKNYSQAEEELIKNAIGDYSQYADHVYISEGMGEIGAEQIRETVKRHIAFTGNTPIVFIDYLQILAPANIRATDKQNTDKNTMELKRISRDFKTPVIAVSSFNRASYKEAVTMEAFKESGAIEYSSDVLIGLQLRGAGTKDFDANEAKTKNPREVELIILKNRNGRTGDKLAFKYYPLFNYFTEEAADTAAAGKWVKISG